jgi:putative transcriptional regulator
MNLSAMFPRASDTAPTLGYLSGQLLVATPLVTSPGFAHSVIFLCAHDAGGAMGIIINHIIENISYRELFEQLSIEGSQNTPRLPVHYGGPVEINRGFVIYHFEHAPHPETLITVNNIAISSSIHVLRDIAAGKGPTERILALGYAGWASGQLEAEIESNSWISVPSSRALIFDPNNDTKWNRAAESLGIDIRKLTSDAGHA